MTAVTGVVDVVDAAVISIVVVSSVVVDSSRSDSTRRGGGGGGDSGDGGGIMWIIARAGFTPTPTSPHGLHLPVRWDFTRDRHLLVTEGACCIERLIQSA